MRPGETLDDIMRDAAAVEGTATDPGAGLDPEEAGGVEVDEPTPDLPGGDLDGEDLDTGSLVDALTGYAAGRLGEKWRATPEESKALSEALNRVMIKYAPIVGEYSEEAALAFALFGYLLPRLAVSIPAPAGSPGPVSEVFPVEPGSGVTCPVCHGARRVYQDGLDAECITCRGTGQVGPDHPILGIKRDASSA